MVLEKRCQLQSAGEMAAHDDGNDQARTNSFVTLKQYVESVLDYSSQYGGESSLTYSCSNLIGKPTVYPNYGDFVDTYAPRTYGTWWDRSPSSLWRQKLRKTTCACKRDYIDVKFQNESYPLSIDIYETYNPGGVVRILAFDSNKMKWEVLWECDEKSYSKAGEHRKHDDNDVRDQSRIFSPPIKLILFPTQIIRLEICHYYLDYYGELDAILLSGASIPNDFSDNFFNFNIHERLLVHKKLHNAKFLPNDDKVDSTDNFVCVEEPCSAMHTNYFETLPNEVIHLIMSYLDLISLCRASCVCKLFHKHCCDSLLFMELDLQRTWEKVTNKTLNGLKSRCHLLRTLNLSWCGSFKNVTSVEFQNFISACGVNLTSLILGNCQFVDNQCLKTIGVECNSLQEFNLQGCRAKDLDSTGFHEICHLTNLHYINLYRTLIDLNSAIIILRSCHKLEHLNFGACGSVSNFDALALEMGRNCRNLKSVDFWRAKTLTGVGISFLARGCHNLEEIDLGWCTEASTASPRFMVDLVENSRYLKKIFLTTIRSVDDTDLLAISANCTHLEQLDILGTCEATPSGVIRVLTDCKMLCFLDVSFCTQISEETVKQWRERFPRVAIKRSYQIADNS